MFFYAYGNSKLYNMPSPAGLNRLISIHSFKWQPSAIDLKCYAKTWARWWDCCYKNSNFRCTEKTSLWFFAVWLDHLLTLNSCFILEDLFMCYCTDVVYSDVLFWPKSSNFMYLLRYSPYYYWMLLKHRLCSESVTKHQQIRYCYFLVSDRVASRNTFT